MTYYTLSPGTGQSGRAPEHLVVPTIPFGIFVPIVFGVLLLLRSARIAQLVDAVPLSILLHVLCLWKLRRLRANHADLSSLPAQDQIQNTSKQ